MNSVGMKWRWKQRCTGEPVVDLLFFVGCVVVGNAVDVERFGSAAVDGFEKLEKLLMAMLRPAAPDDLAFQYVERGEQARRAVAFIVMLAWFLTRPFFIGRPGWVRSSA